jgi:hypothetical protein
VANRPGTPVVNQPRRPPVRVKLLSRGKLRRVNANLAKADPPDGENKAWWARLKQALDDRFHETPQLHL